MGAAGLKGLGGRGGEGWSLVEGLKGPWGLKVYTEGMGMEGGDVTASGGLRGGDEAGLTVRVTIWIGL